MIRIFQCRDKLLNKNNDFQFRTTRNELEEERKNAHSRWILRTMYIYRILDYHDSDMVLCRTETYHIAQVQTGSSAGAISCILICNNDVQCPYSRR